MTTGERIRHHRIDSNWTQGKLAKIAGIPVGTIRQYESGRREPQLPQLKLLAKALGISILWLADLEVPENAHLLDEFMQENKYDEVRDTDFHMYIDAYHKAKQYNISPEQLCNIIDTVVGLSVINDGGITDGKA